MMAELATGVVVVIVGLALIALIWMITIRTVQEQRAEVAEQAGQALAAQAATMAETVAHELMLIEQSLAIIQSAWQQDRTTVDLDRLRRIMPALTEVADDLFISDEKHVIRQDILPRAVGQQVGADYITFPQGALEQYASDGTTSPLTSPVHTGGNGFIDARQFLTYIVRPLDHPAGWQVGASYRSSRLTKLFAQAALGYNPVVALIDTRRGAVQAVVGPAARHPLTDLSNSPLFNNLTRSDQGIWLGETAIDGFERIHAFHRVASHDMVVLVATSWASVTASADSLASFARALAVVATGLVLSIGGLLLWGLSTLGGNRKQQRIFHSNKSELGRLRSDAAATIARSQLNAERLRVLINGMSDGVATFDANLQLMQWNNTFLDHIGITLRQYMPLDALLREQASHGMFAPANATEVEVARRAALLRSGDAVGVVQFGPDRAPLTLRGLPIADCGCFLLLQGMTIPGPTTPDSTKRDKPMEQGSSVSATIDR